MRHLSLLGILLLLFGGVVSAFSGSGTGTIGDPYMITSCSEFIEIKDELGAVYELANDIDCTSLGSGVTIKIGTGVTHFEGVLDGGGNTITYAINESSLSGTYHGLFQSLSGATIENLTIEGTIVSPDTSFIGLLAGNSSGSTISNLDIIGGLEAYGSIGGLFGISNGDSISSVTITADIGGYAYVGGVVGDATNVMIDNISVEGDVSTTSGGYLGGIVGNVDGGSLTDVNFEGNVYAGAGFRGGIAGNVIGLTVERGQVTGLLSGGSTVGFGGGVFGNSRDSTISDVMIEGDHRTGDLSGFQGGVIGSSLNDVLINVHYSGNMNIGDSSGFIGGLIGAINSGSISMSSVRSIITGGDSAGFVGGFFGTTSNFSSIANSYMRGEVYGGDLAGFIGGVGGSTSNTSIENVYVVAYVTGSSGFVEPFLGSASSTTISNSYWDSDVSGFGSSSWGVGKTSAQLKVLSTFATNGWNMRGTDTYRNDGYPFLANEVGSSSSTWLIYVEDDGGKKSALVEDECENGDISGSMYDGQCGDEDDQDDDNEQDEEDDIADTNEKESGGLDSEQNSLEENNENDDQEQQPEEDQYECEDEETTIAYTFAREYDITTLDTCEDAALDEVLLRKHAAKMVVNFAQGVLGMSRDTDRTCQFEDMSEEDEEMNYYAMVACQMGLMGLDGLGNAKSVFEPNVVLTKAQLATVLSRALYGNMYNTDPVCWYCGHVNALENDGILNILDDLNLPMLRGWTLIMMERASQER